MERAFGASCREGICGAIDGIAAGEPDLLERGRAMTWGHMRHAVVGSFARLPGGLSQLRLEMPLDKSLNVVKNTSEVFQGSRCSTKC